MVKEEGKTRFVYDDKELAQITKHAEDANFVDIFESKDILNIQKRLEKLGLSVTQFVKIGKEDKDILAVGKKKGKKNKREPVLKPLFMIEDEKDKNEFYSLKGVLDFIRNEAQKGIHLQRYKGLGEMNPQQLWDTTMDPARRTILKVALEDAVEVDKIFMMLMGDDVEPRREFIETNAHEVKNLDI